MFEWNDFVTRNDIDVVVMVFVAAPGIVQSRI